jgi:hypothetical protein
VVRPTLTSEQSKAIQASIDSLNTRSLLIGGSGLLLQFAGGVLNVSVGVPPVLLSAVGTGLVIWGLVLYAKMRGHSPWLGLLGLLSCLGMLILAVLPKKWHNCGRQTKGATCDACGAPAPK